MADEKLVKFEKTMLGVLIYRLEFTSYFIDSFVGFKFFAQFSIIFGIEHHRYILCI